MPRLTEEERAALRHLLEFADNEMTNSLYWADLAEAELGAAKYEEVTEAFSDAAAIVRDLIGDDEDDGPVDPRPSCPFCKQLITVLGVDGPLQISGRFFLNNDYYTVDGVPQEEGTMHVQADMIDWQALVEDLPPVLECGHCGKPLPEEIAEPLRKLF
jgi:hypothetical protein